MKIVHKDGEFHCPICGEPVKRVVETDIDPKSKSSCYNEYGIHSGATYSKYLEPKTSPPEIRFANR